MDAAKAKRRLDYLRKEIEAERISYGEIAELQSLVDYIDDDDVVLLEWAGVPEEDRYKHPRTTGPDSLSSRRNRNRRTGTGEGDKMNRERRLMAAKQLLALAKQLTAAPADEEGDDAVDEQMAGRIRNIRMKLNKLGQKKTRKLNTFGVEIIRPSDTVEDLIGAVEKVLAGIA